MNTVRRNLMKAALALFVFPATKVVAALTTKSNAFDDEVNRLANLAEAELQHWMATHPKWARDCLGHGIDVFGPPTRVHVDAYGSVIHVGYSWRKNGKGTFLDTKLATKYWDVSKAIGKLLQQRSGAENFVARRIDPVAPVGFASGDSNEL